MICEIKILVNILGLSSSKSFLEFSDSFEDKCIDGGLNLTCDGILFKRSPE